MDQGTIIPARSVALDKFRTDLANWPNIWAVEHCDVAIGHRIVESVQPFLVDLLQQGLADKTLARHLDHLQMLGGEIIRRRQDDPDLAKQPVGDLLLNFVEEDGGPLIWPRITESAQNAFDATCRKLHRFLNQQQDRT
jgi:uncharacterized protein YijF (DUF1287 family)